MQPVSLVGSPNQLAILPTHLAYANTQLGAKAPEEPTQHRTRRHRDPRNQRPSSTLPERPQKRTHSFWMYMKQVVDA